MKSKYVLLTVLSALVVGMGGANAADGLQVATKSYSDTHLASKDITAPTTNEKNKVVTVNSDATGFTYTTAPSAGNGISKSSTNAFSVNAATNGGINVASGGVSVKAATTSAVSVGSSGVDVKVDGTTITKNATNGTLSAKQAEVFTGPSTTPTGSDGTAGLVPAPTAQGDDWNKYLKGDGTWSYPENTTYSAGNGVTQTGTTFSVKPYNGINVDTNGVGVKAYNGINVTSNGVGVKAYNGIDVTSNGVAVKPKASTGAITVDGNGVAVNVDGSTIKVNSSNKLEAQQMGPASSSAAGKTGLVPAPAAGKQTSFLRGDGTWVVPTNTTYSNMTGASSSAAGTAGLVPAPAQGDQGKFLRGDGTWVVPTNTTYSAGSGITKSSGNAFSVNVDNATIKVNGSGNLEAQQMGAATSSAAGKTGLVPAPASGDNTKFLRGDGTWVVPTDTNTTYSAGGGIGLSGTTFSAKVDEATIKVNSSGKLEAQQMGAATSSAAGKTGLVPAPAAGSDKSFLRGDATWVEAYTKSEVDNILAGKQASLSTAQLSAVNSGITSTKVSTYDGYAATIATKAAAADLTAEVTRATGIEGTRVAGNYYAATDTLAQADKKIDAQVKTNTTAISTEKSRAQGVEGTRVAGNYYAAADTLAQADKKIDAQVKTNATAIAALQSDTIRRPAQCTNGHKCALVQTVSADGLTVTEEWVDLTAVGGTSSAPTY